ncbi:hypothetical protein ACROAG_09530 [Shewanella oncorhynchi]|uniref:hypothetical protein n=1 Tax=Shewanella oncorhynchi TaxID=2726434 RepID=UPI003D7C075B
MYSEVLARVNEGHQSSTFFQSSQQFISSLEQAEIGPSVDHWLSVIQSKDSLQHLVDGMAQSDAKEKLISVLEYNDDDYSKFIASIIPFLRS